MDHIPTPTKPREVLCFFATDMPTKQGDAYVFLIIDVFSKYMFLTGVEPKNDLDTMLKHIKLLMNDSVFKQHKNQPFTLVFHKYEQYREKINALLKPYGGTMAINDPYLTVQMMPALEEMYKSLGESMA